MNIYLLKFTLLFTICITLFCEESIADEIPYNQDAFTEYAAAKIREELSGTPVSVKAPLTLSVGELQANLHRVFGFCSINKQSCSSELSNYTKGLAQAYKDSNTPPDKNSIRLVVRTTEYLKNSQFKGSDKPPINEPFVKGFVIMPVLDTPKTIRSLNEKDLKMLNLTQIELFDLAKGNLKSNLKPLAEIAKPVKSGEIGTIAESLYDTSRIALHSEWEELAKKQNGVLLVSLPATDKVMYVSESTPYAIDALEAITKDIMSNSPSPLSNKLFRWTPSNWELIN